MNELFDVIKIKHFSFKIIFFLDSYIYYKCVADQLTNQQVEIA